MDSIILILLNYLRDFDKMKLMKTCTQFYWLRDKIQYTDMYSHWRIKHLDFIKNFRSVEYVTGLFMNDKTVPDYITHLRTYAYDTYIPMQISGCDNVKSLIFGDCFNEPVELPKNITNLKFGRYFNQPVHIPNKVKYLMFGSYFNQPVHIPKSVRYLTFGDDFNQPVHIPDKVKHLMFGIWFNQPIQGCIPNGVKRLIFGHHFNQDIQGCIPNSVEYLFYLNKKYSGKEIDIFRL